MIYDRLIAKRYARAFVNDKTSPEEIDLLAREIKAIVATLESDQEIREFFTSPVIPRTNKMTAVARITEKLGFSAYTRSMLEILIRKDRFNIIDAVAEQLQELADVKKERIRITLTTASEPSVDEIREIAKRIGGFFKRETVVERSIDPSIIGGFVVEGDGKLIDMSVKGQLRRLLSKV